MKPSIRMSVSLTQVGLEYGRSNTLECLMPLRVVMVRAHPADPDVRIEKEAKTLSKAGYEVTVLAWGRYGKNTLRDEHRSGYTIRRFQFRAPWGVWVIFFLPIWWVFELIWLLRNKWDIVHSADFDTLIPALLAAKIKNKPIIYDIFDFYADQVPLPGCLEDYWQVWIGT